VRLTVCDGHGDVVIVEYQRERSGCRFFQSDAVDSFVIAGCQEEWESSIGTK
jgi:hypothetical protein